MIRFENLTDTQKRFRMLGTPIKPATGPQVVTNVYRPPIADEMLRAEPRGVPTRIEKIVEVTDSNGTVKLAIDENGTVVDAEKKGLTPLQMGMIAVGAFLLFGG